MSSPLSDIYIGASPAPPRRPAAQPASPAPCQHLHEIKAGISTGKQWMKCKGCGRARTVGGMTNLSNWRANREKMMKLFRQGLSVKEVAKEAGVSGAAAQRVSRMMQMRLAASPPAR